MDRKEKIQILRGLASGEIRLTDLRPKNLTHERSPDGNLIFKINGVEVPEHQWWVEDRKEYFSKFKPNVEQMEEEYIS